MQRRWLWPTGFAVLLTLAGLRGLGGWPSHAGAVDSVDSGPRMSEAEYRYFHSQAAHWRALMLKH
jgi:hypothetical protein